jgi:hypothetical protein
METELAKETSRGRGKHHGCHARDLGAAIDFIGEIE